ncbi:hypothetical protein F5I97DRAFT_118717 [Phlebopus sp. FC_14]|nr:hypothetical protein F5I97DRAFT_118717 [Phlebopus sp. FC_14]
MASSSKSEDNTPLDIPDFARAWSKSVRRPAELPDPRTYHQVIEPQAIFELDEEQEDGSLKTILVVPPRCEYCKGIAQACSRTRPACARCRKRGTPCKTSLKRFDILPGPKQSKPAKSKATNRASALVESQCTADGSEPSHSQSLLPERAPLIRAASGRLSKGSGGGKKVVIDNPSSSKRPSSPEATVVAPRKKRRSKKDVSEECPSPQATEPEATTGINNSLL